MNISEACDVQVLLQWVASLTLWESDGSAFPEREADEVLPGLIVRLAEGSFKTTGAGLTRTAAAEAGRRLIGGAS